MSKNQKTKHHQVAVGLAVYKTGNSPFWYARVWDARNRKNHVRSTKCELLSEAIDEAYLIRQKLGIESSSAKVDLPLTFRHFAKQQMLIQQRAVNNGSKSSRYVPDDVALLERKADGILSEFGDHHVQQVTTRNLRAYLDRLNGSRNQPLAPDTQNRYLVLIGKILRLAVEEGVLQTLPQMPRVPKKDKPRPSFSAKELRLLLKGLRELAESTPTTKKQSIPAEELYCLVGFLANSGMRPTLKEVYAIRNKDIETGGRGKTAYLKVVVGDSKVEPRVVITLPQGKFFYERLMLKTGRSGPNDFVFFPEKLNRKAAASTASRHFKSALKRFDLEFDPWGKTRVPYSLRHYYIHRRLDEGVSVYEIAKNVGTSVDMIERFYAKFPTPSDKRAEALNAGSQLTRTKKRSASSTLGRSTSELEEKILELHDQGKKVDEIVAILNATEINVKLTLVKWDRPTD